ncbi:glycosyltransferase [Micromonospora fluostatini]|uniref:glycosyltransferase n=1 Tax=Micromonospora sp. JCM 30529 TaxID=3421643 RepID=UPI003D175DF0
MLTIPHVSSTPVLADLCALVGPDRTDALHRAAESLRTRLGDEGTLWHVNSTAAGGGVAEMLQTLLPLYHELGVRSRWAVIGGDDRFFVITKRLGLALYGSVGDAGPLGPAERDDYLAALAPAGEELVGLLGPRDVVVLHDHQTAGLVDRLAARVAAVYWRCHVGVDAPTEASERGWDFVAPMLSASRQLVFSIDAHVPPRMRDRPVRVLPPFITPFGAKNGPLSASAVRAGLAHCGLRDDPGAPRTVSTPSGAVRLAHPPTVVSDGPPPEGEPLVTQVSRWDRLKDMAGVLTGVAAGTRRGHLALVGPDPDAIADDVEQRFWYAQCLNRWRSLPGAQRRRVSLVCLPMADLTENAFLVNAVQRASTVVVQKSLAEGFGLTVAEAMWKSRVVVGSAVGGIRAQITHGVDGLLLDDPTDLRRLGKLVDAVLDGEVDGAGIGVRARHRVLRDFLPDREVLTTASMIEKEGVLTR